MKTLKVILIIIGVLFAALVLLFLILGIKVAGTVFLWVLGALLVIFLVLWLAYTIGKAKGRRNEQKSLKESSDPQSYQ